MKVVVLGSGNVATHMAKAMFRAKINIFQIYSRNIDSAKTLAVECNAAYCNEHNKIFDNADIYIYAVKDAAIKTMCQAIKNATALHLHVSGSTDMSIFEGTKDNYGVIYPLQTLSKNKPIDFSQVPLFIEANNEHNLQLIWQLSNKISNNVTNIDSQQRQSLHVAAVFACNFSNFMYQAASDILKDNNLEFELLQPLIAETSEKIKTLSPHEAQTGPAVRFDKHIISKHFDFLSNNKAYQQLYVKLSNLIHTKHKMPIE